jgi:hypothetical protein
MKDQVSRYEAPEWVKDVQDWQDKEAELAAIEPEEEETEHETRPHRCMVCKYWNGHASGCPEQD